MVNEKSRKLVLARDLLQEKRGRQGVTRMSPRHESILTSYRIWYAHTIACAICREEWSKVDPVAAKGCFEGVRLWTEWRKLDVPVAA